MPGHRAYRAWFVIAAVVSLEVLLGRDRTVVDYDGGDNEARALFFCMNHGVGEDENCVEAPADAEAAAVGKVGVKLTQLELTQPAAVKAARRTGVIVEVDLPGAEAQRTPNLQPHGDGKCAITFKQSFDAASGSKVRKAIAAALQSDEQTDSEVQFAVLSVDAKGEEKELGVAAVSLEALLEAAGASAHARAFEEQQYTLADIYSALRAGELMTDLAQLIPILGVRRRIITCLIQP